MNFRALFTGFLVFVLPACGVSVDAPLMMTCDMRTSSTPGQCQEWRGDKMHETNVNVNFDTLCTSTLNGSTLTGECPTGFVGVCTERPSATKRVILTHYYEPDYTVSSATNDCTGMGGSFSSM